MYCEHPLYKFLYSEGELNKGQECKSLFNSFNHWVKTSHNEVPNTVPQQLCTLVSVMDMVCDRLSRQSREAESSAEYLLIRIQQTNESPPLEGNALPPSPTPLDVSIVGVAWAVEGY